VIGLRIHSLALLTDAGHNLGDVAGMLLSLLAFHLSKIKSSGTFTYGYRKSTILAALGNAVLLLVATGVLGYEAVIRFGHPQAVPGGTIAWVAALGIGINLATAMLFLKSKDTELNAKGAYLHMLGDALVAASVVVAGIVIRYTHWYWLDTVVSLVVLLVILYNTWDLLTDSLRLSMDAVPGNVQMTEVMKAMEGVSGVVRVHHVHVWAMSTTENALTAQVATTEALSFEEKMHVVQNLKHELLHQNIQHATIELESSKAQAACPVT
jgi:cobalt-zinc-cadmium efflux system protein